MVRLLTGPACAWSTENVTTIGNEAKPGDLADRLMTLYQDISDVALFYYVGHGQLDDDDELCLGLVDSRAELSRRYSTSLPFSTVRRALRNSQAAIKIVILDCCYSGKATQPHNSLGSVASAASQILDSASGAGAYVMTASSPYQEAWTEVESAVSRPQTYFTKYFADTVESGEPGQPRALTLGLLFKTVRERLTADDLPMPEARSVNDPEGYFFARNMAPVESQYDVEATVRELRDEVTRLQAELLTAKASTSENTVSRVQRELHERQAEIADIEAASQEPAARETVHAEAVIPTRTATPGAVRVSEASSGISSHLRHLRESAGLPSAAEISRLTLRTDRKISEQAVHDIMSGRNSPSVEETLAIVRACGVYADKAGGRLPQDAYDREAWRARHERLSGDGAHAAPAEANESDEVTGMPEPENGFGMVTDSPPNLVLPGARSVRRRGPATEEVQEARRLLERDRQADAETVLRREARNGSIEAMHEMVSLYQRQGRTKDAERALREASEAGSSRASKALERLNRQRRDSGQR
jgi:hypothetical protein